MFFKKKAPVETVEEPVVNREELIQKADTLTATLDGLSGEERIQTLDEIGLCFSEAKEYDQAIHYLETSLDEHKAVGDGYRELLKVYNIKRRQAAVAKDDKHLQYYLAKIDDMMRISKEVLRSNL